MEKNNSQWKMHVEYLPGGIKEFQVFLSGPGEYDSCDIESNMGKELLESGKIDKEEYEKAVFIRDAVREKNARISRTFSIKRENQHVLFHAKNISESEKEMYLKMADEKSNQKPD